MKIIPAGFRPPISPTLSYSLFPMPPLSSTAQRFLSMAERSFQIKEQRCNDIGFIYGCPFSVYWALLIYGCDNQKSGEKQSSTLKKENGQEREAGEETDMALHPRWSGRWDFFAICRGHWDSRFKSGTQHQNLCRSVGWIH